MASGKLGLRDEVLEHARGLVLGGESLDFHSATVVVGDGEQVVLAVVTLTFYVQGKE